MAKSTKKIKAKGAPRDWTPAFRGATWVVVAAVLAAALWLGVKTAWAAMAGRPEFRVEPLALAVNAYPAWVRGEGMVNELREQLALVPADRSIFDPDIAAMVRAALDDSAWTLEVTQVRRELPNSLQVKARFRKPAGLVLVGGKTYMVDADGYWLPDRLFVWPDGGQTPRLPVIVDRLLSGRPPSGRQWDHPRVAVGARLAQFLARAGLLEKLAVDRIDVTGVDRDAADPEPDIVLHVPWERADGTMDQALVKWGRSSVYEAFPELGTQPNLTPDSEKLDMLASKLRENPGLRGVRYVDLRFSGQIVFAGGA